MSFYLRDAVQLAPKPHTAVDWEECACPLCGSERWSPLVEASDRAEGGTGLWFLVVQCSECGMSFTNPRPTAGCMEQFYPTAYPAHRALGRVRGARWWHGLPIVGRRPELVRKALPLHGQGRLLDFGCGSGTFILRMREQGWRVTGLDMSEGVVDRLRTEFGVHALTGSLPHPALADGSFDVITMWQALEHVHQPLEVLEAAQQLLAPGGKLIVAVPNIDSLAFRWFGSAWNGLDLPRHLLHFNPSTLRRMLKAAGFLVGRVAMVRRSGWLRDSARLATRQFSAQPRWFRWLQGRFTSNLASWYGYCTRQADCMMVVARKP